MESIKLKSASQEAYRIGDKLSRMSNDDHLNRTLLFTAIGWLTGSTRCGLKRQRLDALELLKMLEAIADKKEKETDSTT